MLPVVFRRAGPGRGALTLSIVFAVTALIIPSILRPVHRVWMMLGNVLGAINSKIILGLIYYVVVTPVRVLMTLFGHDPMHRKFDKATQTYRVLRKARLASHMKHQF
jgi:hypothetical protein